MDPSPDGETASTVADAPSQESLASQMPFVSPTLEFGTTSMMLFPLCSNFITRCRDGRAGEQLEGQDRRRSELATSEQISAVGPSQAAALAAARGSTPPCGALSAHLPLLQVPVFAEEVFVKQDGPCFRVRFETRNIKLVEHCGCYDGPGAKSLPHRST